MTRTIVVGAGIAGLVVARELVLLGHTVRILEASDRAGGQVSGTTIGGARLDRGAEAFATRDGVVLAYLTRLGLDNRVVAPLDVPAWLCTATGELVPLPRVSLYGIPSSPLARDVVRAVGRRGAWRGLVDAVLPGPIGSRLPTLGALVRRRMGDAIVDRLVGPVVEGVFSTHPDRLPMSAIPGLVHHLLRENSLSRAVARMRIDAPAGSLVASLDGGMSTLIEALLADLDRFGVEIVYDTRVVDVHPDRVRVERSHGGPAEELAGCVVVAAPGLARDADGSLGKRVATHLVTLVLSKTGAHVAPLANAPRGTGVLVARGGSVQARALTHVTAKWPHLRHATGGQEVLRLSYEQPVDVEQACRDAAALLGVTISPEIVENVDMYTWHRALRIAPVNGVAIVGEQVAGTGLAAVIPHAIETAAAIGPPSGHVIAERSGQMGEGAP